MRFRHRPTEVEVIQWFKPGDHPAEREPHPMLPKGVRTSLVIPSGHGHGDLDVHPGDFIVSHADGKHEVLTAAELAERFEPVPINHGVTYYHT